MTASDPAFIDSSVVLSILLGQPQAREAAALWDAHPRRAASILLEAECRTVLRRTARARATVLPPDWRPSSERLLEEWLESVSLHAVTPKVVARLGAEHVLGGCRTLDALHLSTALLLRDRVGADLVLITFDRDMAEMARSLGFVVRGVPDGL
ncbi:MAG: hypothetical protein AMXMBFR64_44480 [Myxococcales bacterium]